jgi:hypothetical protein
MDLTDLWPAFTGFLYDQRLLLVATTVVGLLALAVVAQRRGWFRAARRHPVRSIGAIGLALVVAAPVAWYLASPLWVRTALVEPAPEAAIQTISPAIEAPPDPTTAPAPSISSATPQPTSPSPAPTPVPTPEFVARTIATGAFHGSDDFHFGRGTAKLIEVEPGRFHLRLEDFSVRNGPDLYVYLSPSAKGYAKGSIELGKLKATDGSFGYDIPDGIDPDDVASAVIWCKQFSHLFATAPFEA